MRSATSKAQFARSARASAFVLALISTVAAVAQSVPPGTGRFGKSSSAPKEQNAGQAVHVAPAAALAPTATLGAVMVEAPLKPFVAMVNTDSASQQLILENTSKTDTYDIEFTGLTGVDLADFRVSPCASPTLKPGAGCSVAVTYHPYAAEGSTAVLQLTAADAESGESENLSVPLTGTGSANCVEPQAWLVPLSRPRVSNATINCYYNATSNVAFATEAQYLYNPAGTANTISGNLASLQFRGGVQLTLAGNANTNSCSNAGTNTSNGGGTDSTTNSTNSTCGSSTSGASAPSLQQDVQTLTQGGNFALKALWPIVNARGKNMQLMSVLAPKMGFEISGISGQNTATGATNVNGNFSSETYFQLDAIPPKDGGDSPGSIFLDYRAGAEHVTSAFAQSAGLKSGTNFGLQQFSAGLVVSGFLRISAQRYFGPEQAYVSSSGSTVSVNNFKNWQLVIQLVPSNTKTSNTTSSVGAN